jgi:hypothetical protein
MDIQRSMRIIYVYFPVATMEEHITWLQSTGICMYKAGKTSPNILILRFLLQDRQDGQQSESSGRIPRLRKTHTSKQHKYYDNFWHNCRSATDIVFTKSKVKPKTQIAQYVINELPFHQAHQ